MTFVGLFLCIWNKCANVLPSSCLRRSVGFGVADRIRFSAFGSLCMRGRVHLKPDGTRRHTGGEVKGKLANGMDSQYSRTTSERGVSSITTADAHTSAASSRLN
jgi:hypothetical protein